MMATLSARFFVAISYLLLLSLPSLSSALPRKLAALVQQQPLVLKYHNGPLLKGNITVNLLWYGQFSAAQRAIVVDFLHSLNLAEALHPSVYDWWQTTGKYRGGRTALHIGNQILDEKYSFGKFLKDAQVQVLAAKAGGGNSAINVVLTSPEVVVDGFCMSKCGTHGSVRVKSGSSAFAWVGNPESQCPGQCAWPFHQPIYGLQAAPLVAPNGDVGVDGMVINLATVLAGAVTNPFNNGYFQGSAKDPLEAVSACTGTFGKGAYPGYPGQVLVDKPTGASYNAVGLNGRRYLLPAMWDPQTSSCNALV